MEIHWSHVILSSFDELSKANHTDFSPNGEVEFHHFYATDLVPKTQEIRRTDSGGIPDFLGYYLEKARTPDGGKDDIIP